MSTLRGTQGDRKTRAAAGRAALGLILVACGGPGSTPPASPTRVEAGPAQASALASAGTASADAGRAMSANTARRERTRLSLSSAGGCWLRDGQLWCWSGELVPDDGGAPHRAVEASLPASTRAMALPAAAIDASGSLHFGCAVLASGAVRCWGDNTWGQLGAASGATRSVAPLAVVGVDDATSVQVAAEHACATRRDGAVVCWGNNAAGQCGHDREYTPAVRQLVRPVRVEGVHGAHGLALSASTSCALGADDTWCWGELLRARDGGGPPSDPTRATPLLPLARAQALALGAGCGCALTAEGAVSCFALGRFGCASPDVRAGRDARFGWHDVQDIAAGDRGACASHEDGRVDCWLHAPPAPAAAVLAARPAGLSPGARPGSANTRRATGTPDSSAAGAINSAAARIDTPSSSAVAPDMPAANAPSGGRGAPTPGTSQPGAADPGVIAPIVLVPGAATRGSAPPHRIPAISSGPCVRVGALLDCWSDRFWDAPATAKPQRIRLP